MRLLEVINDKRQRLVWWRAFRIWQRRPHELAPLKEEQHVCASCGTSFEGNYCPRCGQSAKIGRFSFKKALLLFLDVWGLGNRGMFRSIRDLMLRPGYMIRDYIGGMQTAYFPPFKMFFLVTALFVLVTNGMNISGHNGYDDKRELIAQMDTLFDSKQEALPPVASTQDTAMDEAVEEAEEITISNKTIQQIAWFIHYITSFQLDFPALFALLALVMISGFLYIFFHQSPNFEGGMRYSELIVSLVYMANMVSIYTIVMEFFRIDGYIQALAYLTIPVAFHQLTGFSRWRTFLYLIASVWLFALALGLLLILAFFITVLFFYLQNEGIL